MSMSYRDDLDAALARVAALEAELDHSEEQARDLEHLRGEVARLTAELEARASDDREVDERQRTPKTESPVSSGDRSGQRVFIAIAVLVGLFFVGTCEYHPALAWYRAHYGRAAVSYTSLVDARAGVVAVVSKVKVVGLRSCDKYIYWRVDLIDIEHGRHLARLVPDKQKRLEPPRLVRAGPGRMWSLMQHHGRRKRLQLRSTRDLSLVTDWGALQRRNPKLAGGIYGPVHVDADGAAIVTTRSGDVLRVDGATGTAQVVRTKGGTWMRRKQRGSTRQTRLDGAGYEFVRGDDSPKRCLFTASAPLGVVVRGDCRGAATMLKPVFVTTAAGRPLVVGAQRDLIVAHGEVIGGRSGHFLISRLSRKARTLRWTKRVPKGHLTAHAVAGGKALVVFVCQKSHTQSYAVALDRETGAQLWRLEL